MHVFGFRVCVQRAAFEVWERQNLYAVTAHSAAEQSELTMSLLCCFFFRDYGSKRKSGKSPVFSLFPPQTEHHPPLFGPIPSQLVACNKLLCMLLHMLLKPSVSVCLSQMCAFCLLIPLWDADLLLLWDGFKKLSSPLLSGCRFALQCRVGFWNYPIILRNVENRVINTHPIERKCFPLSGQSGHVRGFLASGGT